MHRTHTCGELQKEHIGQTVTLCAWINKLRNMGGLVFIDLRDRYGITQITLDPAVVGEQLAQQASLYANEYVIKVTGTVIARPASMINSDMTTGEIEIQATHIELISECKILPFAIEDDPKTSEEHRMKYRYLDLRRNPVRNNIVFRAQMNHLTRNWFTEAGFLEVQTPLFTVSSPEGAKDYLIPSRVNPGQWYALPQAPQQYKQLLMVGGIDKYFQIAPCFRDEDPRADRHSCEFYQVDCEMSFVEKEDIYTIAESYCRHAVSELVPHKSIMIDFHRLSYHDAMEYYGSDKPDLRFGSTFVDLTSWAQICGLEFLAQAECVKGFVLHAMPTRKEIDELTTIAKIAGAGGLAYVQIKSPLGGSHPLDKGGLGGFAEITGSIANKLSDDAKTSLLTEMNVQSDETIVIIADKKSIVLKSLDKVRNACRDMFHLVDNNTLGFVWIEDFPFFEESPLPPFTKGGEPGTVRDADGEWTKLEFAHNPFSNIKGGRDTVHNLPAMERQTTQYDLTCNGYEILSGSIRNHDPEVLLKVFETAGYQLEDIKKRFGTMYEALQYGCPPHGGFAFGFDRLMMILRDEPNIRECYAFPKSGRAQDIMMGAPSLINSDELKASGVQMIEK